MLVLGLQGSPRKNGNTAHLLSGFLSEAEKAGAATRIIDADKDHILPCREYGVCEKKGVCPIKDDMETRGYRLLREADVIVAATPVFFYHMSAQLKALVDRSQTLWARKYILKLTDPGGPIRKGFILAAGATKGRQLFDGIELTGRYFFDAADAEYAGGLFYRGIEKKGDMAAHPDMKTDIRALVEQHIRPLCRRKRILFACRENACRSQIAAAFARKEFGDKFDALSGGSEAGKAVNPKMVDAMKEVGIDMGFLTPRTLTDAVDRLSPEIIVTMGCREKCPFLPGVEMIDWDLPDPAGKPMSFMRNVRDTIRRQVKALARNL